MSAPHPSLDYTFREFEPVAFPKNCTGDNADESWHVYNGDEMSTMANGNHRDGVTDGSVRQSDYSTVEKPLEEQEYTEVDEPDAKIAAVDDLDDTETFSSFALSHSPSDVSSLVGFRDGRVPPNVAMDQNESAMDVGGSGALLANTAALTTSERSVAKVTVANGNHLFGVTDDIVRKPDNTVVGHRVNDMDVDERENIVMDQFLRDQNQMDMASSDRFASGQVSPFAIQHVSQFPLNLSTMDVGGSGALLANTAALATSERSVAKSTVANGNHFFGVTDDIVRKPDNTVVGHRVNDMDVDDGEIIDMDQFLRDQIRMDMELSDRFASGQVSPFAIQHVSQFPLNLSTMDVGGSGALLANTAALATSERSVAKSTVANGECSDTDLPYFMKSPMMLDMGDPGVPRADTVAFATSSDGQSNEASLHAYGDGPYEEEGNDTNMLAPEPTVALSVCAGAARSLSPKLELVKKFDKPLTLDLLATILEMNEVKAMKIPKKELLFKTLSTFMLLQPRGTPRLEGGQVWNGLIRQEEFHELVNKSKLNSAVMSEVTALLMYMKTKMDFIGESFYLLIASCLIGNGVYYCSSRTNATSQYRVLKAVYEAIIGKKPRKQRGQKTP